jgi:hypothetical protein
MSGSRSNLGPSSTRRRLATVIAVVGIVIVGQRLMARWPRETEIAFEVSPQVDELNVDYLLDEGAVASARFTQPEAKKTVFRHSVRLQPGEYEVHMTVYGAGGPAVEDARVLVVPTEGVTRFDLRGLATRSE